jgi:hypothetical protein
MRNPFDLMLLPGWAYLAGFACTFPDTCTILPFFHSNFVHK